MLNDKILPESEQNLKFLKQIKKHFFDKKWLMKFSKFRLVQPKFSFINLKLQTSEFLTKFSLKHSHTHHKFINSQMVIKFNFTRRLYPVKFQQSTHIRSSKKV